MNRKISSTCSIVTHFSIFYTAFYVAVKRNLSRRVTSTQRANQPSFPQILPRHAEPPRLIRPRFLKGCLFAAT